MEAIIVFFRDTLSGTLYTVVSIVCSIFILICLFLLFKRNRKLKEKAEEYEQSHIVIINAKGEEETVEIAKSSTTNASSSTSGVANMSATASLNNVPKSVVTSSSSVNSTIPPSSKSVVTINPLEVASISSTMNVIGATSAQKAALGTSASKPLEVDKISLKETSVVSSENVIDPASIASAVGTTVIDPASIASTVGTTKLVDPESIASAVGTTVIDPASIASTVGATVIDPASIASTVGTTKIMNEEATNDTVTSQ